MSSKKFSIRNLLKRRRSIEDDKGSNDSQRNEVVVAMLDNANATASPFWQAYSHDRKRTLVPRSTATTLSFSEAEAPEGLEIVRPEQSRFTLIDCTRWELKQTQQLTASFGRIHIAALIVNLGDYESPFFESGTHGLSEQDLTLLDTMFKTEWLHNSHAMLLYAGLIAFGERTKDISASIEITPYNWGHHTAFGQLVEKFRVVAEQNGREVFIAAIDAIFQSDERLGSVLTDIATSSSTTKGTALAIETVEAS